MESITFIHGGEPVKLDLEKNEIVYDIRTTSRRLDREVIAICHAYMQCYQKCRGILPFDNAKQIAAYSCIPKTDLFTQSIDDIANEYGVTKEFAQYRINLQVQQN